MEIIQTKVKKWGNSFGVIIPSEVIVEEKIKENDSIAILILRDSKKVFKETFGILKGKLTKSSQQLKNELRKEIY